MKRMAQQAGAFLKKHFSVTVFIMLILISFSVSSFAIWRAESNLTAVNDNFLHSSNALFDQRIALIKKKQQAKPAEEAAQTKETEQTSVGTPQQAAQTNESTTTTVGCAASGPNSDPGQINVVVNKKHCMTPLNYAPPDLQAVDGATLSTKAAGAFDAMYRAAAAAGLPFGVSSSYRSYSDQVSTYNYWVQTSGQAGADTYSARPGYSEHQTGLAADLSAGDCVLDCFINTEQYQWLRTNAASYGFIERYPPGQQAVTGYIPEAWHWRYVGTAIAQDMKAKNILTLEQYFGISGGDY